MSLCSWCLTGNLDFGKVTVEMGALRCDRLFSSSHPKSDRFNADQITTACPDITCICHRSLNELVFTPNTHQSGPEWQQEVIHLTGLSTKELEKQLQQSHPFAIVHRSVREDLEQLCQTGWLTSAGLATERGSDCAFVNSATLGSRSNSRT